MVKIENLKEYIGKISQEDFFKLSLKIYEITSFLSKDYPKYKKWFFTKQLPGVMEGERNILFVRNPNNCDEIISVACLKKNNAETKLCNLYVKDEYRNLGIGTQMLEESIKWLGTPKPLVTFSEYKVPMFSKFIIKETKGQYIYKIGLGNKGDICISFYNNYSVVSAIRKWNDNK